MVNWQEAGRTWPRPHPHAPRLLRGLVWDQHYRHSHPQCEGGMPGSFELREDMGEDRLRAVEEWLRAEGYEYRFRRKRWRTWTRPDRPGEGLRPDGIEEDEEPKVYPSGASGTRHHLMIVSRTGTCPVIACSLLVCSLLGIVSGRSTLG